MTSQTDPEKLLRYLIGQVMKATNGRADPELVRAILLEMLDIAYQNKKSCNTVLTEGKSGLQSAP